MATCALWLSRVPTVMSLRQLEEEHLAAEAKALAAAPARPECAVAEVLGARLPKLCFAVRGSKTSKRVRSFGELSAVVPDIDDSESLKSLSSSDEDSDWAVPVFDGHGLTDELPQTSMMDTLLLAEWEDRAEQGLFRYDVTACPTKVVPGLYGFIAQLNEGRASKKRPTEFRVDQVNQEFDDGKFNFKKALQKEVLFQLEPEHHGSATVFKEAAIVKTSPNLVFINVSPIEYGHVLLVPRVLDNINQVVDGQSLLLALYFARESGNPYFRVGYNSLGAFGTINHLHFQAYYLAAPFAIERAPTQVVPGVALQQGGVVVTQLAQYPVRGLVFEGTGTMAQLAGLVGAACHRLTAANIPHNLFIADCGARIFLLPNCFAERKARGEIPADILATQVDPAAFEICGHIVAKRAQDYEAMTQDFAWRLLELASQDEATFANTVQIALQP